MTRKRFFQPRDEDGAILLLVLFFVLGIGLALAALVSLSTSNLSATAALQAERNIEYSADAVVDGAIQAVRTVAPSSASSPSCPNFPSTGGGFVITQNTESMIATCSMGTFASGRIVEFVACPASDSTFASCSAKKLLVAEVEYADSGCSQGSDLNCSQYGTSVTIESWVVKRANE